ncbi:phosphoribosylpyrophosphate synthetase [Chondrinema litorale]|uniref:phosphoribosylpyrophosphate synthetase n=1 Tax=Chondrinema litorale TaxID=2994555 RepID=UPI0025433328|nr:phosphoribosylpyrophosphate synthetase [Chondrinema litorale]UZR93670.1 phosphoribosylpyrophosphate synthetase [Chondrinema litorale]
MKNRDFDSLTEAINLLVKEGFTEDFQATDDYIEALKSDNKYKPEDLKITEQYRFEGMTDPDDSSELLAIEAKDGIKGTMVMAYGAKHSQNTDLIKQIKFEN